MNGKRISVLDTTLRDGAQTPGVGMSFRDRYYIARALTDIGVDVIEAGFAANNVDFPVIEKIARYIGSREHSVNRNVPVVCSLARVLPEDVELAYKSIEEADPDRRRIHVFIGTSEELMNHSHGKKEEAILDMISGSVSYARELLGPSGQVQYSSEDSLRTDIGFLVETVQTAVGCGADVINVPDTTGFARPDKYYETIMELRRRVKGIENVTLAGHMHNDGGNTVATTLKGIEAGIRQVEGCVLQLGERAGNADWMSVITNLNILKDHYGVDTDHIDTSKFYDLARLVSSITGYPIPLTHPVVGEAAFSESSGIHVKGVINDYSAYFIIPPETVGRNVDIVLGQTSGTNTVAYFLREHGYGDIGEDYTPEQLSDMTSFVKEHSIRVRDSLTETESRLFAEHFIRGSQLKERLVMKGFQNRSSMESGHYTTVRLELDSQERKGSGSGEGPVDSYMNAVKDALGMGGVELHYWDEKAVYRGRGAPGYEMVDRMKFSDDEMDMLDSNGYESSGQKAVAESVIELLYQDEIFHGRGFARDINKATYDAIIDAFDALYRLSGS